MEENNSSRKQKQEADVEGRDDSRNSTPSTLDVTDEFEPSPQSQSPYSLRNESTDHSMVPPIMSVRVDFLRKSKTLTY